MTSKESPPKLSAAVEEAWIAFLRAHRHNMAAVEAEFRAGGYPPLSWYDVLLELKRAQTGLRAVDLERRLLVAQYNVSRLLLRMERAGLIHRTADPADRRGRRLHLTDRGRQLQEEMWPIYAPVIQEQLGAALSDDEARQLTLLLNKLHQEKPC